MRPFIAALVFAFSLVTTRAHAQQSLGSLAMLATSIVKARRIDSSPSDDSYERVTRYRIVDVYAGPLHAGDTVGVPDGGYPYPDRTIRASEGPVGADVVLFLEAPAAGATPPTYPLVIDGLFVTVGRAVNGFSHGGNYGSIYRFEREPDADELNGESHGGVSLDFPTFERQLRIAIARVAMLRGALQLPPSATRTSLLLSLLPRVHDHSAPEVHGGSGDVPLHRVVAAFQAEGNVDAMLEAVSRLPHHEDTLLRGVDQAVLLARAAEANRSAHQRVEAILGLGDNQGDVTSTVRALLPLVRDSEASVRTAAITALGRLAYSLASGRSSDAADEQRMHEAADEAARAISHASETERDERVRFAMLRSAHPDRGSIHVATGPGRPAWAFVHAVDGAVVTFGIAHGSPSIGARVTAARMVPIAGGSPVACTAPLGGMWSETTSRVANVHVTCPSAPSGRYRVEVDFAITGSGVNETRTVAAGEIAR